MARNQKPIPSPVTKPEFVREGTTTPSYNGEVRKFNPIAPDEFRREESPVPSGIPNNNIPDVNPNPDPSFLTDGKPVPVPLPDTNLVD